MATIKFDGFDKYLKLLDGIDKNRNAIIKPAVYEGAAVVVEEVKKNLRRVVGPDSTGDLERSMGLSEMQDDWGFVNTKLGFDGYDRRGNPNIVKARALESGTSKQPKRPFIRPAVNAVKERAVSVMSDVVDEQIQKIMDKERG